MLGDSDNNDDGKADEARNKRKGSPLTSDDAKKAVSSSEGPTLRRRNSVPDLQSALTVTDRKTVKPKSKSMAFSDMMKVTFDDKTFKESITSVLYQILQPMIEKTIHHKRHFIKIPFINKGIKFIDLPSIFKDRSVTSSIPAYFQNSEPPIICYKYNKPIRNTVFNFNKLVSDLDIHANTPES